MLRIAWKVIAIISYSLFFVINIFICGEKIRYIATEHPNVTYKNPKYISGNMTSLRYGRNSPIYYVGINMTTLFWLDNNLTLDFYFYEYLTNVYKRGFIEMHLKFCDFIHKDKFFGQQMRQGNLSKPCPYPPGEYHLYNMSINPEAIPRNFPFIKGRIYCNVTYKKTDLVVSGYIDMEVKEFRLKRPKEKKSLV